MHTTTNCCQKLLPALGVTMNEIYIVYDLAINTLCEVNVRLVVTSDIPA